MTMLVRLLFLVMATLLTASGAGAATVQRFVLQQGKHTIEVTAPRNDIVRVRMGNPDLPHDESWAVRPELRRARIALTVNYTPGHARILTNTIAVEIDRKTLAVAISDRAGHVLLADAPGNALVYSNGGFRARKTMPADMHYFGLGDKTAGLDRRGSAFSLWNTDSYGFGEATDPLYKSIPFVLGVDATGSSFGLFVDNHWRSSFDFGKSERDTLVFGAEGGPVDYYVLAGPDAKHVIKSYAALTGSAPLAPLWSLGFQQSHWSYMSAAEARGIAKRLRDDHIPADVLYLDIDYQDRNRPFTVNNRTFPDLPKLVRDLKADGIHTVLITDLHIAQAKGQGYRPYDDGVAHDVFLKRPDGSLYVGDVWPGSSVFPDFSRAMVRDWWGRNFADFTKMGVAGFWNDMNEPAIFKTPTKTMPLDIVHGIEEPGFATRTARHAEMHNIYGMLNSRATYEGVLKLAPDTRPFVLTRASFAGGQRYAATWTGDNVSTWAHLKLSIPQLVNLGLSGFGYAGDDIGGFAGDAPSPDLLTRWIQIGAFNPIFRDHYQKGKPAQEVWVHGRQHEDLRRAAIETRYRLLPYIYMLADENSRTGLPLMRPVFLEFPAVLGGDWALSDTEGQFMLGDALLVAPPTTGESPAPYTVKLPSVGWYDYWTGRRFDAASVVETPHIDRLPVFVRPGSIVAHQPLVQSTSKRPEGPLELRIYPGKDCQGAIYADDGVSFAYRRGAFLRQSFRCDRDTVTFGARQGQFKPWWTGIRVVIAAWEGAVPKAHIDGRAVKPELDPTRRQLVIDLPDVATATTLVLTP